MLVVIVTRFAHACVQPLLRMHSSDALCVVRVMFLACAMAHIEGMPSTPEGELVYLRQEDFVRIEKLPGKTTLVHLLTGERCDLEQKATPSDLITDHWCCRDLLCLTLGTLAPSLPQECLNTAE